MSDFFGRKLGLILLALFCFSSAAAAGDMHPVESGTIIVTAQRVEEDIQQVPQSITVLRGNVLEGAGVDRFGKAVGSVPNLWVIEFGGRRNTQIHMRGVGSSRSADSGVGLYVDDVPYLHYGAFDMQIFDVDRIEILRGPQGALYGRNTLGGQINVVTRPATEPKDTVSVGFGNAADHSVRVTHSGKLTDDWAASFTGLYTASNGFTENDALGGGAVDRRATTAGRGHVAWLDGDWSAALTMDIQSDRDGGFPFADIAQVRSRPHHVTLDYDGFQDRDIWGTSLAVKYRGDPVHITSVTAYRGWSYKAKADVDFTPFVPATGNFDEHQHQFTEELRASSAGLAHGLGWQAGVFFFRDDTAEDSGTAFAGASVPPLSTSRIATTGAAFFGQCSYEFLPKLTATAGLRWDFEHKGGDMSGLDATATPFALSDRQDFSQLDPQFSLSWRPDEDFTVYADVSRGFKSGGFNSQATSAADASYGPEYTWNFEVGARSEFLDHRCSVNASAFYILWKDQQVIQFVPPVRSILKNAAATRSAGFEFEAAVRPVEGLELTGSFGLADARFTAGPADGNRLSAVPEWTGRLGAAYERPLTDDTRWFVAAEVAGVAGFYWDTANTLREPSYALIHLRTGIRHDNVRIEAWVCNLLDTNYAVVAFPTGQPAPIPSVVGQAGDPLTVGVRATVSF